MSLKLHPDKGGDIEDFKELNAAMQFIDGLYGK
jgi:curved DNA-binding protein CbpA